jgi:hypothetical protein
MKTSDPITLFQQFVEVLVALLTHPQTPPAVLDHFQPAAVAFVSESCGYAPDVAALRPALLRAFSAQLAGTARPLAAVTEDEADTRAFAELGRAVATIERHRDYLPIATYNSLVNAFQELENGVSWGNQPALIEQIMPLILRQAVANQAAQEVNQ